jgi:hypothetical protein
MTKLNEIFRDSQMDQLVFEPPVDDSEPGPHEPRDPAAAKPEFEEIDDYTAELLPDYDKPEREEIDDYTAELLPDYGKPEREEIDDYTAETLPDYVEIDHTAAEDFVWVVEPDPGADPDPLPPHEPSDPMPSREDGDGGIDIIMWDVVG